MQQNKPRNKQGERLQKQQEEENVCNASAEWCTRLQLKIEDEPGHAAPQKVLICAVLS